MVKGLTTRKKIWHEAFFPNLAHVWVERDQLKQPNEFMKKISVLISCWLAVVWILGSASALATDGSPVWTNLFNGTGNSDDGIAALAVDASGNVCVTGFSVGSGSYYDYVTIKYLSTGAPLWTNRFSSVGAYDDEPEALAVDGSGNVYVTGTAFIGSDFSYATIKYSAAGVALWTNYFNNASALGLAVDGNGNAYVTGYAHSGGDWATIKYSNAGVALWTNRFNGPGNGNDEPRAIALDASNNVYVTGYATGSGGVYDYATIKYSTDGVALWTNFFHGTGNQNDEATALAVDGGGNVYVTGYSTRAGSFSWDYATIKYSAAGAALWTNLFNGTGNGDDSPTALAVDASGNVYVTGDSIGSGSGYDYATIKYSSTGLPLWTNRFNGTANGNDFARALAVDASGNVFVTGNLVGSGFVSDVATIKYSTTGATLWTNIFNGAANNDDAAYCIVVDAVGNAYVAGGSYGLGTDYDFLTIKYSGPAVVDSTPLRFVTTKDSLGFTNGQFVLTLTGPANSNAVISACSDLQSWNPLTTNQLSGGILQFTDATATNYSRRYYRARLQ